MRIMVASKNPAKLGAVNEALKDYFNFANCEIFGVEVNSGVSEYPKSLEETVRGAINRAISAFDNCTYSFGIESGLMVVPQTKTGKMVFSACVIYDGKENCLGLSSAFEFPPQIIQMVEVEKIKADEVFYRIGLTRKRKTSLTEGAIGILTGGRVTRKDYIKQAVHMALIQLEHKELYRI